MVSGTSYCPILSPLKHFGIDLRRYVDPCPALVSKIIAFPEAKIYFNDLKNMKIGTWNATTLENDYRIDIMTDVFRRFDLDLLGVSEIHISGVGSMELGDIEFVYSGRKDGVHIQGAVLMMNKEAAKSYLGLQGINNRILIAHFMTKKFRVSVIVVYAPVEPTDGDTSDSDEFYLQLQEQIDRVPGRILLGIKVLGFIWYFTRRFQRAGW